MKNDHFMRLKKKKKQTDSHIHICELCFIQAYE